MRETLTVFDFYAPQAPDINKQNKLKNEMRKIKEMIELENRTVTEDGGSETIREEGRGRSSLTRKHPNKQPIVDRYRNAKNSGQVHNIDVCV